MTIYQEYECTECPTPFGSITKFPSVYDTDLSGNAGKWKTYQSSKESELYGYCPRCKQETEYREVTEPIDSWDSQLERSYNLDSQHREYNGIRGSYRG